MIIAVICIIVVLLIIILWAVFTNKQPYCKEEPGQAMQKWYLRGPQTEE